MCIEGEPVSIPTVDCPDNNLRKTVSFLSIGTANNIVENLNKVMEIGAEAFPETMKYVIGTNVPSKSPKEGDGNLFLHGGSEITGDLKVDGNLIVKDSGVAGHKWIDSVLPKTNPSPGSSSSKFVLSKNMYLIGNIPLGEPNYLAHIKRSNFDVTGYTLKKDVTSLF